MDSPYDEIPAELMHAGADLEATAAGLQRLTETLLPDAESALRGAMARQTSGATAEALRDEAVMALRLLLENPDELNEIASPAGDSAEDRAWIESLQQALEEPAVESLNESDDEWMTMRSQDLARSMATFWWNLGTSQTARLAAASRSIESVDEVTRLGLARLASRFSLTEGEARQLLDVTRQRSVALSLASAPDWQVGAAAHQQMLERS